MMAFMACLSVFGIITGIGLILLRNWARISVLIWGGLCVFFGVCGIAVALFMPFAPPPNAPNVSAESMAAVRFILLGVYGLPSIIGVWWIILFNRKTIKAQFAGAAGPLDPTVPQKPRAPLPVTILAWLNITVAAHILVIPFLPFSLPAIFFGHVFRGAVGTALYVFICLLVLVAGVGLLKLKPWSYPLTIGLQLFGLASGIVSWLNPNYESQVSSFLAEMNNAMHLPPNPYYTADSLHAMRWTVYIAFLFPVAILALLFYYRERFLEAASAASSGSWRRIPY
jgi:hypothetical protein